MFYSSSGDGFWYLIIAFVVYFVIKLLVGFFEKPTTKQQTTSNEVEELKRLIKEKDAVYFQSLKNTKEEAVLNFNKWKSEYEIKIRKDAIDRSTAVTKGKISEHLIPFIDANFKFNPNEARFIGSPIDMIVFSGIDSDKPVKIYFLEIKTGSSTLSKRQKLVKDAVLSNRVYWEPVYFNKEQVKPTQHNLFTSNEDDGFYSFRVNHLKRDVEEESGHLDYVRDMLSKESTTGDMRRELIEIEDMILDEIEEDRNLFYEYKNKLA